MAAKNIASAHLVERRDLTEDLVIMKFEPSQPFLFKPGQYCTIGVGDSERPYSIVSAPHEPYLELFIELVPNQFRTEKSLTPRLWKLAVGDSVTLRPSAKGVFALEQRFDTHIMIATVTGIVPFISMIRAYRAGYYGDWKWSRYIVFQGASYPDEFGYLEELDAYQEEGLIRYVPTVSHPQEGRSALWRRAVGRVHLILEACFPAFRIQPDGKTICYLCGNESMVKALGNKKPTPEKQIGKLVEQGFEVKEEIFF